MEGRLIPDVIVGKCATIFKLFTSVCEGESLGLGGCPSCPGSWPQCEVEQVWTSTTPQIQTNTVNSSATSPTTLYPLEQCYSESMSPVSSTSSQTPTGFKIISHNSSPSLLIAHLPSQPIGSSHLHPLPTRCFHVQLCFWTIYHHTHLVNIVGTGIPAGFARVLSRVWVRVRKFVPVPVALIINCGNTMLPQLIWLIF
jgi:hypothetical protein